MVAVKSFNNNMGLAYTQPLTKVNKMTLIIIDTDNKKHSFKTFKELLQFLEYDIYNIDECIMGWLPDGFKWELR